MGLARPARTRRGGVVVGNGFYVKAADAGLGRLRRASTGHARGGSLVRAITLATSPNTSTRSGPRPRVGLTDQSSRPPAGTPGPWANWMSRRRRRTRPSSSRIEDIRRRRPRCTSATPSSGDLTARLGGESVDVDSVVSSSPFAVELGSRSFGQVRSRAPLRVGSATSRGLTPRTEAGRSCRGGRHRRRRT